MAFEGSTRGKKGKEGYEKLESSVLVSSVRRGLGQRAKRGPGGRTTGSEDFVDVMESDPQMLKRGKQSTYEHGQKRGAKSFKGKDKGT